jgi:RNA-directed DNA polymerase
MELKDIKNQKMLASFLGIEQEFFKVFLATQPAVSKEDDNEELKKESLYIRIHLRKKNGKGYRTVYQVSNSNILNAHKELQSRLNKAYSIPECVHGFVHKKNIKSNASFHLAKKVVLKLDIKNFFESITAGQVATVFQQLGCTVEISEMITKLVTLDGKLVQGFVTSPVIANLVFSPLDTQLESLCKANGFDYTRYADDITISSNTEVPQIAPIEAIIEPYGFKLNNDKTNYMYRGKRQYVTGLTVFDDKHPRISKNTKRRLRLQMYYLKKYGAIDIILHKTGRTWRDYERDEDDTIALVRAEALDDLRNLRGRVDFVNAIEPKLAKKLYIDLEEIQEVLQGS